MPQTNRFTFRYYIHLEDGRKRMHTSNVTAMVTHNSFRDMVDQIKAIIHARIGIDRALTFQLVPAGHVIHEYLYDQIPPNATLCVFINDTETASMGCEPIDTRGLMTVLNSMHTRLRILEAKHDPLHSTLTRGGV